VKRVTAGYAAFFFSLYGTRLSVIALGESCQRFLEGLHEPAEILEPLAVAGHAGGVSALVVDPGLNGRRVIDVEAGGAVDGDPAADDVFVAPAVGDAGVEAAEDVEVVVEDCEAADGNGEVLGEEFEPGFDPGLAVRHALAAEEGAADAAGNAVVVAGDRDVHQLPSGHRHRGGSYRIRGTERPYPTPPAAGRQGLCMSFSFPFSFPISPVSSRIMPVLLVFSAIWVTRGEAPPPRELRGLREVAVADAAVVVSRIMPVLFRLFLFRLLLATGCHIPRRSLPHPERPRRHQLQHAS